MLGWPLPPDLTSTSKLTKGSFPLLLLGWVLASQPLRQDASRGPRLPQGKKLPAGISEDAEEGEVSDEDSADEIDEDCKLLNGDVSRGWGEGGAGLSLVGRSRWQSGVRGWCDGALHSGYSGICSAEGVPSPPEARPELASGLPALRPEALGLGESHGEAEE